MVTVALLMNLLVKGKLKFTDPVGKAVYTRFKKVSIDSTLGQLSRMLDTDHFVLVVHQQRQCETRALGLRAMSSEWVSLLLQSWATAPSRPRR